MCFYHSCRYSIDQLKEDVAVLEEKVKNISVAAENIDSEFKVEVERIAQVHIIHIKEMSTN